MGLFDSVNPDLVSQAQAGLASHVDSQVQIVALLEQIAQQGGAGLQTIAITDQELGGGYEVDFPVEGGKRWLVSRLATGGDFVVPSAELVHLLAANNRRLGGTIVNRGAKPVKLILSTRRAAGAQATGLGPIWLQSGGGSWDFRLGSILWCGSVCAIAEGAESTVSIVEV
jgi:hypothetical protein